ncbi:MAG: AIPR family protein [Candidatus Nanopelagicales bacterium]
MKGSLEEYRQDFFQDVLIAADATGQLVEDAFFELFTDYLVEAGELETADRSFYNASRGVRIDGYGGDPLGTGTLNLIIVETDQAPGLKTLTATEMGSIFKRAVGFLRKALDRDFRESLEEASPAFGLADMIQARWPKEGAQRRAISKVKIVLMTDRVLSSRVDGIQAEELDGVPIVHTVWDIGRLYQLVVEGRGREEVEIDLVQEFGSGLAALPAHVGDADYATYLLVVPGDRLARIYDRWGARLLEQNVRVFLQALGAVNKGIRNTLEHEPEMFLAYNNGITATAEEVESDSSVGGLTVTKIKNLQIVNGGQTTASIHEALRRKVPLDRVFVQMKLSVIPHDRAIEIVPKISEYANSQNKVNAADFFANHPFHVRMEGFSRRLHAPSADGQFRQSKWFYERARGQYRDERARRQGAKRRQFDEEFPKGQVFTKTDLAKSLMVWLEEPHTVSKGAQKNFAAFAGIVGKDWEKNSDRYSELYYQESVAQLILFRETERLVQRQPWYAGGYRANIVAYALAKIAHDLASQGRVFDFMTVWRNQKLDDAMVTVIESSARAVQEILVDPPASHSNITEWAKQQACWDRVRELRIDWAGGLDAIAQTETQHREEVREGASEMRVLNGIEAQTMVVQAGSTFWIEVLSWAKTRGLLSAKEAGILSTCASVPRRIPSDKQSIVALGTLERLRKEGMSIDMPLSST